MNKLYCLIIMFFTCGVCEAQNLVINGDFEDTVSCPTNYAQVDRAVGWSSVGNPGTSPDYLNTCSTSPEVSVPYNQQGYQVPHSGNGYCGVITFNHNGPNWYRELIGSQLASPLQIGTQYYISFYANFAMHHAHKVATDKLGVLFSTISHSLSSPAPINNFAHIYTDSIITDSINWVQIKGSFVADSNYSYINVGSFFDDSHTDTLSTNGGGYYISTYYFVDDICVSNDSNFTCFIPVGINEIKNEEKFLLFPNPFHNEINITTKRNELIEINLFDVTSRKIFNQSFTNSTLINSQQLAKGIYLYEVRNKNGVIKKGKIVKD